MKSRPAPHFRDTVVAEQDALSAQVRSGSLPLTAASRRAAISEQLRRVFLGFQLSQMLLEERNEPGERSFDWLGLS